MTDNPPSWLATMRQITGTDAARDNDVIVGWAGKIGGLFPEMAQYCAGYTNDTIAWCGLTVGYCMAINGIRPVFGATGTDRFLWALAWRQFGTPVDTPQLGDVLVFTFSDTDHHVTLYEGTQGNTYVCRGGNQSHAVKVSNYPIGQCIAVRRPPAAAQAAAAMSTIPTVQMFSRITATVFGGIADPNHSAYDGHLIDDRELGVALPYYFRGSRPDVRVWNSGKSVVCKIVDVGPWNTNDPYWQTGKRPQAESGVDGQGRATNGAGIDLTPAAAKAIGIDGKGLVDWEFADAPATPSTDPIFALLQQLSARLETPMAGPTPSPSPTPATTGQPDLAALIQQVIALMQAFNPQPAKPGTPTPTAPTQDQIQQIQQVITLLSALLGGKDGLGQVNGALGQTIGNLLNGKKTAIGIIGALVTAILQSTGPSFPLSNILPLVGASAGGLSGVALPIFLAMAAWGILGKFEKWAPSSQSPTK